MPPHDSAPDTSSLARTWVDLLAAYRPVVRQDRTFVRLTMLAIACLTGYRTWGLGPGTEPDLGGWYTPRRWSIGRLRQGLRQEVWDLGDFQPVWSRSPDPWHEMTTWVGSQTNAILGARPI